MKRYQVAIAIVGLMIGCEIPSGTEPVNPATGSSTLTQSGPVPRPFVWPADNAANRGTTVVTGVYAALNDPVSGKYHTGIDITADAGSPVHAVEDGVVAKVYLIDPSATDTRKDDHCLGNVVIIDHGSSSNGNGRFSLYAHLSSVSVSEGNRIGRGATIGAVGRSGFDQYSRSSCWRSNQPDLYPHAHVHFEIKDAAVLHNPQYQGGQNSSAFDCGSAPPCYWGYTTEPPDNEGYHDPIALFHRVTATSGGSVHVTVPNVKIRVGPGSAPGNTIAAWAYPYFNTIQPGVALRAFGVVRGTTSSPACTNGWQQVALADGLFFDATNGDYAFGTGSARIPNGWVCSDFITSGSPTGPASVAVSPAGATISSASGTQTFSARAFDSRGNGIPNASFAWSSLNPTVATINASTGVATPVSSGQVIIAATTKGVTGYALITVAIPGATPVTNWTIYSTSYPPAFTAIWGSSASDIWAVGTIAGSDNQGWVFHYDGTSWSQVRVVSAGLFSVWGSSASDVWFAGNDGIFRHYHGGPINADASWEEMASGYSGGLGGLWGASPRDIYALASNNATNIVIHYNGTSWAPLSQQPPVPVGSLWGTSSTNVYALSFGSIFNWNGNVWSSATTGFNFELTGLWGTSPTNLYAGNGGAVPNGALLHFNGSNPWTELLSPVPNGQLVSIWGSADDDVYATGYPGRIVRCSQLVCSQVNINYGVQTLRSVWGTRDGPVWAVGDYGVIYKGTRGVALSATRHR